MSSIVVTSNILTEASNFAKQIAEPARTRIATAFRILLDTLEERHIASRRAAEQPEFPRLWLTDAGILDKWQMGISCLLSILAFILLLWNAARKPETSTTSAVYSSHHHHAAVDDEGLAGDEGAGFRGEQEGGAGDVFRLAEAAQRRSASRLARRSGSS